MLRNYPSSDETHVQYHLVQPMLPQILLSLSKARTLALANFCVGLVGVPDHQVPDCWEFYCIWIQGGWSYFV
jgi:hypothetical protein